MEWRLTTSWDLLLPYIICIEENSITLEAYNIAIEAYKWLPKSSVHPKENTVRNMVEITRHNQTTVVVVLREYGRVSSSSM